MIFVPLYHLALNVLYLSMPKILFSRLALVGAIVKYLQPIFELFSF